MSRWHGPNHLRQGDYSMEGINSSREEYRELLEAKVSLDIIRNAATTIEYNSELVDMVKTVLGIENKED